MLLSESNGVLAKDRAEGESGAAGEPSRLRPRRPLRTYARLIAARSGMRRSPFQRLAAPIAVASRPAPARLASPVAWSPFAPPIERILFRHIDPSTFWLIRRARGRERGLFCC